MIRVPWPKVILAVFAVFLTFYFVLVQTTEGISSDPGISSRGTGDGVVLLTEPDELLEKLTNQNPGAVFTNPIKHAVRNAVEGGVPADTIVLLLLLPVVATVIASARHLVGLQGFGIFLPAALSIVFVATGPVVGIGLFLVIVSVSTCARLVLRKLKIGLQYLPRMAFILWAVVVGVILVLFSGPLLSVKANIADISIFPVLILVLLAEDFTRVQLGKSVRVAVSLTSETLVLALISFGVLELRSLQEFALTRPELLLVLVALSDLLLGRYTGLRVLEFWRFRKLVFGGK